MSTTLEVFLCNTPAYLMGAVALWKKFSKRQWTFAIILLLILLVTAADAYFASKVFDPATDSNFFRLCHSRTVTLFVPLLYMLHSPEEDSRLFTPTTLGLWALTLLFFLPKMSIELVPSYAFAHDMAEPVSIEGVSIFYKGKFVYHLYWVAFIVFTQSMIALSQLLKLYKRVTLQGAHYSSKSKAIYFWNMSCGLYLAVSFFLPLEMMQTPTGRWIFFVAASLIIGIGSFLIFLGFDLNPIIPYNQSAFTMQEFLDDNEELVKGVRHLIEDEKVYLEAGLHSDYLIHTLGTTRVYFNRVMQVLYGCSYVEYANRKKVEHAKLLLDDTDLSLEQIAFDSGFSTYIAFYYIFLHETGKSPVAWRNGTEDTAYVPQIVEDD